ncbi:ccr4 not transcription complex [Echinococcus multilocularis]|uniref:Ccr4 not transcription complex n=1 Tax=Echinococcus multilocularis TaxID=6211 RepID=A0A068XXZ3_ECHMU|nr:ccr4 not transcription complex [Echinococcus multilocularis]
MWPAADGDVAPSRGERDSCRTASHSSSTAASEPTESGDDEDILGLISSSLDRFNAQLHHNSQVSIPIPINHHGNHADTPSNDISGGISSNISNSVMPSWASFAVTATSNSHHQQSNQGREIPGSLAYSGLSLASSTNPTGLFCGSSGASSSFLQRTSMPSPPGLPTLSHQQQPSNGNNSERKQHSLSQTFPDSNETSSLWESHWKALPSEMGMLSVDSGIGGETFPPPKWFVTTNSTGDCTQLTSTTSFSPVEALPPQSVVASSTYDFSSPTLLDAAIKQVAVAAAAAAVTAPASSDATKGGPLDHGAASGLLPLLWPPSWPNTADCSPSTETPQLHFRPGDNQHQLALTSRFETALRQQQQQQSRQVCNRRKAESICFSSAACLNSALLPSNNAPKSHQLALNVGQLGSPPPPSLPIDLCQPLSKSHVNTPQKFSRDLQQQRVVGSFNKSCNGVLGVPKVVGPRGGGSCRLKRTEATPSFSSSSSTSSSEISSDKPVIAKWRRACSFYLRGHCKKEDCEFAHDLTKVTCKFWEVGECFKGLTCPFLHGYPPELLLEIREQQQQEQQQLHQQEAERLAGKL